MSTEPKRRPSTVDAEHRQQARQKASLRAIIAVALISLWTLAALTGFLLYLAPTGPRSGRLVLLFLTKAQWGDVHFWVSVAASIVTIIHIAIDRRALQACVRYLTSGDRTRPLGEP
jgi:hypothetical protein